MGKKKLYFQMSWSGVEVKDGAIRVRGFASTPEMDRYDDIVRPSAFEKTMPEYMKNPIVLLGHDSTKPIGTILEYTLSEKGLEVYAEITNDIENVVQNITNKVLRGFSIGFYAKSWNYNQEDDKEFREITEVDLVEISVVSIPANPTALFSLAKSVKSFFDDMPDEEKQAMLETKSKKDDDGDDDGEDCPDCGKPLDECSCNHKKDTEDTENDQKSGEDVKKEGENPKGEETPPEPPKKEDDVTPPGDTDEVKSLKETIASLEAKVAGLEIQIRDVTLEKDEKEAEIEVLKAGKQSDAQEIKSLESKNGELEKEIRQVGVSRGKVIEGKSAPTKTVPMTYESLGYLQGFRK